MATLWNCTVQKTWECMLYSTYHDAAHQSNLKQRNPQKLHDFTDLSCYHVILPLMDRRASSLALFILLSVLYLRMPRLKCKPILSWDNGLSTDLLSCLLLSIIATWACCFYRKSMSLLIWLLPECFLLPPFWTCLPLLLMLGQIYISLSAAYSVWFFGQGDALMQLCLLVLNDFILFLCLSLPAPPLPLLLCLSWLICKSQRMK